MLTFSETPDYENPDDDGTNNEYIIIIQVSDGTNIDSQTITISITDINEYSPVITSNGGGDTATINYNEYETSPSTPDTRQASDRGSAGSN